MTVADAVRAVAGGVEVDVEVVPGSLRSAFPAGYNEWRKRVQAKVAAPPEAGRANEELVALAAEFFGVSAARVAVVAGARDRKKRLRVLGPEPGAAARMIAEALP
ncbi:MAG: DUF167 domain-containing protein [Methanobacteriota archaeon]